MAVTANPSREKKKGKKPPTFQHLPRNRAAKLKKEWIEKAKVRSQWKSQKRKGDTADTSMPRDAPPHQVKEGTDARNDGDEEMGGRDRSGDEFQGFSAEEAPMTTSVTKIKEGKDKEGKGKVRFAPESKSDSQSKGTRHDATPRKSFKERLRLDSKKQQSDTTAKEEETKPSLRELSRTAYSPASLHNVKSNQRHRHPDSRKDIQGSSGQRKGGQPNMRLRMEAMLEQIKRDYS